MSFVLREILFTRKYIYKHQPNHHKFFEEQNKKKKKKTTKDFLYNNCLLGKNKDVSRKKS